MKLFVKTMPLVVHDKQRLLLYPATWSSRRVNYISVAEISTVASIPLNATGGAHVSMS